MTTNQAIPTADEQIEAFLSQLDPFMQMFARPLLDTATGEQRAAIAGMLTEAMTALNAGDEAALSALVDRIPGGREELDSTLPLLLEMFGGGSA